MGNCQRQNKHIVETTPYDQNSTSVSWQDGQDNEKRLSAILEQHDENENVEIKNTDSAVPQARKSRQRMISTMASRRQSLRSKVVNFESKYGSTVDDVYYGLNDGRILGTGVVGTVRKVTHRRTGKAFACKIMDVKTIRGADALLQLRTEIEAMCTLDHPYIVRLEEVYESDREICLILQLCTGGELFDRLDDQPDYRYTEKQAAELVGQMLGSVRYVHSRGIVHRDLKLENFLFVDEDATELRMIDFGLAKYFKSGEDVVGRPGGTPYTMAPEALKGIYSDKCDVWSIGVIAFLCLSGDAPFGGCTEGCSMKELYDNINNCKFSFEPTYIWGDISETAKDFIRTLLTVDPKKRPSAAEALEHPWLDTACRRDSIMNPIGQNVLSSLKAFKDGSHLRRLLSEVVAFTMTPKQIGPLHDEFKKLDPAGTGEISLEALRGVMSSKANTGGLGNLGPSEVADIFDAMRVGPKKEAGRMVQWREFIAAATSMAEVDEVNLRLAFDRIDYERKGHINVQNLKEMFGEGCMEEYAAAFDAKDGKGAQIYYEDFVAMMKLQYFYEPADQKQAGKEIQAPLPKNRRMSVMLHSVKQGKFQSSRLMRADVFNAAKAFEIKMSMRDSFDGSVIQRPKLMRKATSGEPNNEENEEELAHLQHARDELFRLQNLVVAARKSGRSTFRMSKSTVSEVYYENASVRDMGPLGPSDLITPGKPGSSLSSEKSLRRKSVI